jgi:ribosomal protein S18 acetylase RimI-like enzyme
VDLRRIIREEIEKVMTPQPEVIQIDYDNGSIFGVVHHDREHLNNWAAKERVQPDFDTISDSELFPIGILKNINVNEEHRGQGHGADLFDRFMVECSHCAYVVLIADTDESNDFDLIDWYKRQGFTIWGESGGMPVMVKKMDSLEEIDLSIGHNPGFKPGIGRHFPQEKEGGDSLNLSVDDGPHQFPKSF